MIGMVVRLNQTIFKDIQTTLAGAVPLYACTFKRHVLLISLVSVIDRLTLNTSFSSRSKEPKMVQTCVVAKACCYSHHVPANKRPQTSIRGSRRC